MSFGVNFKHGCLKSATNAETFARFIIPSVSDFILFLIWSNWGAFLDVLFANVMMGTQNN